MRSSDTPRASAIQHADRRRRLGRSSEQAAVRFLRSQGYEIKQTNVRFPVGEIDVIAWEGHTLCLIEVRSTTSTRWGGPLASITDRKRRRLIRAAQWYLARCRAQPSEIRFDVVAALWAEDREPAMTLIRGAFEADGT